LKFVAVLAAHGVSQRVSQTRLLQNEIEDASLRLANAPRIDPVDHLAGYQREVWPLLGVFGASLYYCLQFFEISFASLH